MKQRRSMKFSYRFLLLVTLVQFAGLSHGKDVLLSNEAIKTNSGPNYYVVSVGVNNYADSFWPALKWPVNDATKVIDHFGGETKFRVEKKLLVNESATLDQVTAVLNDVSAQARSADTVILYVSGHGTLAQTAGGELEQFVVLHDTRKDRLLTTGLSHASLLGWLDKVPARRKLIIFATCHSGEGKSRLPPKVAQLIKSSKGDLLPLSEVSEGILVLAAAAKGEAARENDTLQGDIYTHYLLEALSIYDRNKDGMVSALEAHDYARDRTWTFTQGQQRPTAHAKFIGDADIPLFGRKKRNGLPVLEAYDIGLAGFYLQVDNQEKGRLPFAFPLSARGNTVALYTPENDQPLARYRVSAGAGQFISLEDVMSFRPMSLGFSMRRFSWSDKGWETLTGSSLNNAYEFSGSYFLRDFGVGLYLAAPVQQGHNIRDPLTAETTLNSALSVFEYRHAYGALLLGARLELGLEKMEIELTDKSTGEKLNFEDDAFAYGVSLMLGYDLAFDVSLQLEAGRRWSKWDFETIGDLDGKRSFIGLGINYRFGWYARTLW